jgi:hypothetical protein
MIRFRTIDPATGETPTAKPAAPAAVVETVDGSTEETAAKAKGSEKGKGLVRKTPLRAKKPDAARTFRD